MDLNSLLDGYSFQEISVATLATHSALNILKGAKDEGFRTIAVGVKGRTVPYQRFPVADQIIELNMFSEITSPDIINQLRSANAVFIPHASLIAYVGVDAIETDLQLPLLGTRGIFQHEASREGLQNWMKLSGIRIPLDYDSDDDFEDEVIVKFTGARGGQGYFLAKGSDNMRALAVKHGLSAEDLSSAWIQEFIRGVTMFFHYYYDPLSSDNLLVGMDRRYESDVDGLGRIPARLQMETQHTPTYSVVGNIPVVIRESLLPQVFDIGDRILAASKQIAPPGLIGPYCAEAVIRPDGEIVVFEISSRIVAGTSVAIGHSPYEYLHHNSEPMYTGRRIARTLRLAISSERLFDVLT